MTKFTDAVEIDAPTQVGLVVTGPVAGVGAGAQLTTSGTGGRGWEILATGQLSAQGPNKLNIRDLGNAQDVFTITSDGKVGIGTTSPPSTLSVNATGVVIEAIATNDTAVFAHSVTGRGIDARSGSGSNGLGIAIEATAINDTAVFAHSVTGRGIDARSGSGSNGLGIAIEATAVNDTAVFAHSVTGRGIDGRSQAGEGVHGETNSPTFAAVAGITFNPAGTGAGVYGESRGQGPAGFFRGNVQVTGDVQLIGADCAEQFDIANAESVEPGTVMALGEGGILEPSQFAYDKRAAGVVSGAGSYKPGIILDNQGLHANRKPIALVGKVYCKVDAQYGAIETGDLLTTSRTPGYAMKATDQAKAFGAIIGKALRPLTAGQGLIPILVGLQ